jgi:hypothetical protein
VALGYLYPDGTISAGVSWVPTGAATLWEAVDDLVGAADDNTTYIQGSGAAWDDAVLSLAPMVDVVEITQIKMLVRYNNAGGGANQEIDFGLVIGGVNFLNGSTFVVSAVYAELTKTWTTNPVTGAPWTKAQLDDLRIILRTQDAAGKPVDSVRVTQAYIEVTYQPIPAGISPAREIASSRLRLYRRPLEELPIDVTLDLLDNELMDDLSVTHPAGPNAAGTGWGATNWQRRHHQLREETIDLNAMKLTYRTRWRRPFLCTHWDTGISTRSSSAVEDGVARLSSGGVVTCARASNAWIDDPGSRLIVLKAVNEKPLAFGGLLFESSATNYLIHSSAAAGATSVAALAVTGASGTFAQEAAPTQALFSSDVSDFAYKWTAGSPHTADKRAAWPATASILANTIVRISIDYMNTGTVAGDRLNYRLQRAVDAFYWNDSSGAWQAGAVDNPLTLAATRARAFSKTINVGGSSTTLTFSLVALSGGTAARIDRVYHVQLEDKAWPTSRIVTSTVTYTRALVTYGVTDASGKRAINSPGGTFLAQLVPEYAAADAVTGNVDLYLFDITYDASNWIRLYYDVSAASIVFEIRAAGVTYSASKGWTPVRDTTYKIAARWTSSAAELGLTARTLSVFIDGVKGTDGTRAADPTRASSTLYYGMNSAGSACNGNFTRILFTQVVLTDQEIKRFQP